MRWTSTAFSSCLPFLSALLLALGALLPVLTQAQTLPAEQGLVADTTEVRVLRHFYNATGGPQWTRQTNWPTSTTAWASATLAQVATWHGVTVSGGDVTRLSYESNKLTGPFPAIVSQLRGLQLLNFGSNTLSGGLPLEIGQLSHLRNLQLNSANLSGALPPALGQLQQLVELRLSFNNFTDSIPSSLGHLAALQSLDLSYNQLSGPLPKRLGQLSQLRTLQLTSNKLTGALPPALGNLSQLITLNASQNLLSGALPAAVGSLGNLVTLHLRGNQLTGALPTSLGQLTKLSTLVMTFNNLTDSLPSSLGQLVALQTLDLQYNQISGPLPARLGQLTQLRVLNLANNQLTGGLPAHLFDQLRQLRTLTLSHNQLTGSLPAALGDISTLYEVNLNSNRLEGDIPGALGQCAALWRLDLSTNRLSGLLPAALANCQQLRYLYLQNNHLQGKLPASWGTLRVYYLYLNTNQLSGPLPAEWGQLREVEALQLARNKLTGTLPASWGGLSKVSDLFLDNNQLTGPVPASWGSLPLLRRLHLMVNQLSGELPATFAARTLPFYTLGLHNNRFTALPSWVANQAATPAITAANNHLDFGSLEPFYQGPGQLRSPGSITYTPQTPIGPADTVHAVHSTLPILQDSVGGTRNVYQWQRQVGQTSVWVDLPGATQAELMWSQAVREADEGVYRKKMTNQWVTGVTLYSRGVYLDVAPYAPLPLNLPVDRAPAPAPAPALLAAATTTLACDTVTTHVNYVRTYAARVAQTDAEKFIKAGVDSVQVKTEYLDGLGRPVQTVLRQESPGKRDLVQHVEYDALGRQLQQYLPYVGNRTLGNGFHPDARCAQPAFYRATPIGPDGLTDNIARTGVAYGQTAFDDSPLNRPLVQAAPGEAWAIEKNHTLVRAERPNQPADSVQYFVPAYGDAVQARGLSWQGAYAANELWGSQTTDERTDEVGDALGYRTIEWKDKQGQVVLKQVEAKRVLLHGHAYSRWLRTYYIYDDFGRLRAVLPPEAVKAMQAANWTVTATAEKLLFRYRYDEQGRVLAKQVPGTEGETQLVYDQLDRPVLSQDAKQLEVKQWAYTKYDALGRVVLTGLVTRDATAEMLQGEADLMTGQYEARALVSATAPNGYTITLAYPSLGTSSAFSNVQALSVAYYDDYNFNNDSSPDVAYDPQLDGQFAAGSAPLADLRTTGMATGSRTRVLGVPASAPGAWLATTTFYDERGRPVQVQSTNARAGMDLVTTQLDFAGKVIKSVAHHMVPDQDPVQVAETMRYDHAGRLLETSQQLPGEVAPVVIAQLRYNELGQLTRKTLAPGTVLAQSLDYAYNIRGWLTHLNNPAYPTPGSLFSLSLHYDTDFTKGYEQYNGNLTGQQWRGRDGVQRAYGYVYDPLNRILQGDFVARAGGAGAITGAWNAELNNYRLSFVSYDDNGNIMTLRRRGLLAQATRTQPKKYGPTDHLRYAYSGNRLLAVDDQVTTNQLPRPAGYNGAPTSLAGDFQEQGVKLAEEYRYDVNGNLQLDKNKGITAIAYNHLNLPCRIVFGQGADSLVFRYTAAGQKVAKLVYQTGKDVTRTDYLGPYQYEADSLRFFPHAEGRVLRSYSAMRQPQVMYEREFTIKDHLGNLRVAYRAGQHLTYEATLEQDETTSTREREQFEASSVSPPVAQQVGGIARTGTYVARLNAGGTNPQPLGPLKQLAVQKGDVVRIIAPGYYPQPVTSSNFVFSLAPFVASLLQQQPAPAPGTEGGKTRPLPLLSIGVTAGLQSLIPPSHGVPKGYVRLLVFDADSNLVDNQLRQLTQAASVGYEPLTLQVTVGQDGYITAYVGNESNVDVFFDDVRIELQQGLQVQENQYDPWGLSLAGLDYSSPGIRGLNQYQYNGKEEQNELGLGMSDYGARLYDGQLGRWHNVDPLADKMRRHSPYNYAFDNPIRWVDPDGLAPAPPFFQDGIKGVNSLTITAAWRVAWTVGSIISPGVIGHMHESERKLVEQHPIDAYNINQNRAFAERFDARMQNTGFEKEPNRPEVNKANGGISNALKHGLFSAMNTQDIGEDRTKEFGDAHERNEESRDGAKTDLHNNRVGRQVGEDNLDAAPSELVDKLLGLAQAGQLRGLDGAGKMTTLKLTGAQVEAVQGIITQMRRQEQEQQKRDKSR